MSVEEVLYSRRQAPEGRNVYPTKNCPKFKKISRSVQFPVFCRLYEPDRNSEAPRPANKYPNMVPAGELNSSVSTQDCSALL